MNTQIPILGITGKARVGKDTFADVLVSKHGFVKLSFATPIREMISVLTGLTLEQLSDGSLKEEVIDVFGKSPRQMMQSLGTQWGRDMIRRDLWLRLLENKVQQLQLDSAVRGIVIADVRFDDEAFFIRDQLEGIVIQINRPDTIQVNDHVSEKGLQSFTVEVTLVNDATLHEYQKYAEIYGPGIALGQYEATKSAEAA